MKKSYWLISALALTLGLGSCSKNSDSATTAKFKIYGVQDLTIQPNTSSYYPYLQLRIDTFNHTSDEHLSLSLVGVPAGCGATVTPASGYVPFNTNIYFTDTSAAPGTYPIKLLCAGTSGQKTYDFNLVILPEPDYATPYIGQYNTTSCSYSTYTENITKGSKTNRIVFNNFDNSGSQVYADITNNGSGISIPLQTVNGVTYYTNSYTSFYASGNSIQFYFYKQTSNGYNNSCTMYLNR